MMGSCAKRWAHVGNDELVCETMGSRWKRRARVRNDGLACETMGSRWKRRARVRNDGLTLETTGSCPKWWARVRNDRCSSAWVGCVDVMLVLTRSCCQEVAVKGSEGIEGRATYGSPLHTPGGSPTPCISSCIFLHHPKPH